MYKRIFNGKKAAIFDLDGTVVLSQKNWNAAIHKTLKLLEPWEDIEIPTGYKLEEFWNFVLDRYRIETKLTVKELVNNTNKEFFSICEEEPLEVNEGFWTFAAELKFDHGFKLGLVTNSDKEIVSKIAEVLGFGETFDYVLCGNDITKPKPDPEIYIKAMHDMGFLRKEYLVFEDSVPGVKAALKAGLETIVVWDGSRYKNEYDRDVSGFVNNFTPFPGTFDKTIEDIIVEEAQKAIDAQEQKPA